MTKKDYVLVATTLRARRPIDPREQALSDWRLIVLDMARALDRNYPNFKYDVFIAACGCEPK